MGFEGFIWWVGVVEDRRDPQKLGRLRTRVLGLHTEDKQLIPTCQLHWAYVYQPAPWNPAMNGLGHSPMGAVEGTWVYGFMRDSHAAQDLVVFGTIHGIPAEAPQPCIGFNDPGEPSHELPQAPRKFRYRYYPNDGSGAQLKQEAKPDLYPRKSHPWGCIVGESDINRLARAENVDDTIMGVRRRQRDVNVPIAFAHTSPGRQWCEPEPTYNSRYPYNHVYESESGHVLEFDDTPGAERIHLWHNTGTYFEITGKPGQEGDTQLKIVGKCFITVMENAYIHVEGPASITSQGEMNLYSKDDLNIQVDGDMKVHVGGNYEEKIHGSRTIDIDGSQTEKIGGSSDTEVGGDHIMHAGGISDRHSGGNMNDISGGNIKQSAAGTFVMAAGGVLSGDAPVIHWNSGRGSTSSPAGPASPSVPPFPPPTGIKEDRNESGPDPEPEEKPDPDPASCEQQDC